MIEFELKDIVPRFIMNDRTGYAMAKAMEAGLRRFLEIAQAALDTVTDPAKMPEWRLDEMAWEYAIPYDYGADPETKRGWIAEARALSRLYGTKKGVHDYLKTYFYGANVQEAEEYGGEPYHFRVRLYGTAGNENEAWARRAIALTQNIRSVLDAVMFFGDDAAATEYAAAKCVGEQAHVRITAT